MHGMNLDNNNGQSRIQQPFRHLTTITADSNVWDNPSYLAGLLQGPATTPPMG